MEPRVILIKPPRIAPLPTYATAMRQLRSAAAVIRVYAALIAGLLLYVGATSIVIGLVLTLVLLAPAYPIWSRTRSRRDTVAIMEGGQPVVVAHEIDGGFDVQPGTMRRGSTARHVVPGDTVTVTVKPAFDHCWGPTWRIPFMEWRFESDDWKPLVVRTYFDPDRALLHEVEVRLRGLGAFVELSHTPFDAVPRV